MTLLREIQAFCARTGMAETRLTANALSDPGFVYRLRNGSRPRDETIEKLRSYMRNHEQLQQAARQNDQTDARRKFIMDAPRSKSADSTIKRAKPRIPVAVLKARELDRRDLPEFIEALVMMGLDCWLDDRLEHGESVPVSGSGR